MWVRRTVLACCLALAACGRSPTSPSVPSYVWTGTLSDPFNGTGAIRVQAAGRSGALLGTWSAQLTRGSQAGQAFVNLTELPARGSMSLNPDTPLQCGGAVNPIAGGFVLDLTGTEAALRGTTHFASCSGFVDGQVELTRQ